jgi:LmbE family N-acetylglucosaminyl deacetylase
MNIAVLAPHTDDEVLGCGGTIAKLIERGYDVHVYAFSTGIANEDEFKHCVNTLGAEPITFKLTTRLFHESRQDILNVLVGIQQTTEPKMVFLPARTDCHQDHQVITNEGLRAFKHTSVYGYELPWNSYNFSNGMYSVLSPEHVNKKITALSKYESQKNKIYFKEENQISSLRFRGMQANSEFAECFEVIRQFL